ncbi:hypothetical protein PIB30_095409 [Stylosanthes scabra]|uniref:Uncharacterized protein n=1 Tax=Stylosanthes scabra TaxID=79078 RepID=A0ABU6YX39_9FABA|nr:hypothetical protein [Stylosanthes scabra]
MGHSSHSVSLSLQMATEIGYVAETGPITHYGVQHGLKRRRVSPRAPLLLSISPTHPPSHHHLHPSLTITEVQNHRAELCHLNLFLFCVALRLYNRDSTLAFSDCDVVSSLIFKLEKASQQFLVFGWIKYKKIKPTFDEDTYDVEDLPSFPMVLFHIPMCNEREVNKQK